VCKVDEFCDVGGVAVYIAILSGSQSRYRTEEGGIDMNEDGPVIRRVVLMIVVHGGSGDLWEKLSRDERVVEPVDAASVGRDVGGVGVKKVHDVNQLMCIAWVGHQGRIEAEDLVEVPDHADVAVVRAVDTKLGGEIGNGLQAWAGIAVATLSEDIPLLSENRVNAGAFNGGFASIVEAVHDELLTGFCLESGRAPAA
jgi:hypothetical protein